MALNSLLPNSIPHFLTTRPDPNFICPKKPNRISAHAMGKNRWLDPFDDGPDPDMEFGSQFAEGKQDEDPRLPDDPKSSRGFLKFPMGFSPEVASLGSKIRGDVRRCCCMVSGGVYENLLFFPAIQLMKDRYPGIQIDILTSDRGKQAYEINKNVRWADAYDVDEDFPEPAEYTDMIGVLKNRYYELVLSTKLAGIGHAAFMFMASARDRASYVYPNVNAVGASLMLTETFTPETTNLSEGGYHMYHQMEDWLGRPQNKVARHVVSPLKVAISRKLKEVVEEKYRKAGVQKGKFMVVHGLKCDSKASMQSRGDTDSLLPVEKWAEIAKAVNGIKPLFVIPHERERENVEDAAGYDANIIFITTPGQLAALISDSAGVIATNTAAIQLAIAREKPSIGLFCSEEKGKVFVPNAEEKKCTVISSKTGRLIDIDVEAVKNAVQVLSLPLALAAV